MSGKSTGLVKSSGLVQRPRGLKTKRKVPVTIRMSDAVMRPSVELISEERKARAEQAKIKPPIPRHIFNTATNNEVPRLAGAEASCETMHGFLSAVEDLGSNGDHAPIDSVKIKYVPGKEAKLFIEGHGSNVWTAVAMDVKQRGDHLFIAVIPLRRAVNVLSALRESNKTVVVSADDEKLLLGPYSIPYWGKVEGFSVPPTMLSGDVQAKMSRESIEKVCKKVAWARSKDMSYPALHGILLDFEPWEDTSGPEPEVRMVLTAVAMSAHQMNVLRMPEVPVRLTEGRDDSHIPPTITVPCSFFEYLSSVVDDEAASLELGEKQIAAAGRDYMVLAEAYMSGLARSDGTKPKLSEWRTVDVNYEGYWMLEREKFKDAVQESLNLRVGGTIGIEIEPSTGGMVISAGPREMEYRNAIAARSFKGSPHVRVRLNPYALLNALRSCEGDVVRIGFHPNVSSQATAPVTVIGEDGNFKSVLLPAN